MNIYGHRGAAGEAPENTIAGCLHAMERGAKYLELDVRLSADRELVVIHDAKVDRTTYSRGAVNRFTAAQLAKLDARRSGPPWPFKKGCGISSLDALLRATKAAKGYFVEAKFSRGEQYSDWVGLLAERFPNRRSAKKLVITSLNLPLLDAIRAEVPHIQLGLLSPSGNVLRNLDEFQFEHLILHWSNFNPLTAMMLRRRGIQVGAWTINDPTTLKNLRRLGVHNVVTDYPSMAIPLLASLER